MTKKDLDTADKIKEAARHIFQAKGFAGTKTRDIAEAADINLALLNYYFRSKKKLFEVIMVETMQTFFGGILHILNKEETSIKQKIQAFVDNYIDLLSGNPNIPFFILTSVREHPEDFFEQFGMISKFKETVFLKQFSEALQAEVIPPINPIHFMINLMGLVVFPFLASPMIQAVTSVENDHFHDIIQERKRLIPMWIEAMLSVK